MSTLRIDRRTFLKAVGVSGAALFAGRAASRDLRGVAVGADAPADPILDLALALEFDMERMYRFVAEEIRYEPYAGVLRGARGTLLTRAGNSADQAVLLAALLEASGIPFRFATAAIAVAEAEALLASAVTDIETARLQVHEAITGQGESGRPITISEPDVSTLARAEEAIAQADAVVSWADAALRETVDEIVTTLDAAGIDLPMPFTSMPPLESEQHVWVQVAEGPDWVDLDPSRPGRLLGEAVGEPEAVLDALPDDIRHVVRFEVFGESVAGGQLREESLIWVEEFADVLVGRPAAVFNTERGGLHAVGVQIATALAGATEYVPCIILGEDVVIGTGAIRFGGGAATDPFAVSASPGSSVPDGETVAEWIVTTIRSPGAEPAVVRRAFFDRLGPSARESGTPDLSALAPAILEAVEPGASPDYMPAQRSHWLTVQTGIVGGRTLGEALLDTRVDSALTNVVQAYHTAREAGGAMVALPAGVRAFVDAPNIVSHSVDQALMETSELAIRSSIDIWHRSFGTLPVPSVDALAPPTVVAGAIAHIAERLISGEAKARSEGSPDPASVGAVFERARAEGIDLRTVRDKSEVDALAYPPDALARLRSSLGAGFIAVAPERTVRIGDSDRVGWWLVDLASGQVRDEMDDGLGASSIGYVRVADGMLQASINIRRLAVCVGITAVMVTNILGVYAGIYIAATSSGGVGGALGAVIAGVGVGGAGVSYLGAVEAGCA